MQITADWRRRGWGGGGGFLESSLKQGGAGFEESGVLELAVAVAFASDASLGEFAEGIEDACVNYGLNGHLRFELGRFKGHEEGIEPGHGDAEACGVDEVDVFFLNEVVGEVESEADFVEARLFLEPIGVATAGVPAGEVILGDFVALLCQALRDEGVGESVAKQRIEQVAGFAREAGDFTGAPVD